jgi:hypothetical protein
MPLPGGTRIYYLSSCQYQYILKREVLSIMIYERTFIVPCPTSTHGHKGRATPEKQICRTTLIYFTLDAELAKTQRVSEPHAERTAFYQHNAVFHRNCPGSHASRTLTPKLCTKEMSQAPFLTSRNEGGHIIRFSTSSV